MPNLRRHPRPSSVVMVTTVALERFAEAMDVEERAANIAIDMTSVHFWDISGVAALDKIVARLRRDGRNVDVVG